MHAPIGTDPYVAARLLAEGRLVGLPTETVYGLGANALDEVAVSGIFTAKNRPKFDPLILHQSSAERILAYASEVPDAAARLAAACWPGPLTLVLPRHPSVPDLVTAGLPTVALRVPDHPLTQAVLKELPFPVAAPSANPFGFVSPVRADHVAEQLGDRVAYILDGGPCRVGVESTIVRVAADGQVTVLRKGGTAVETIESIVDGPVEIRTHGSSRPEAPGMLSRHYSPGLPLRLTERAEETGTAECAVIRFGRPAEGPHTFTLSESGDLEEAARRLFTLLRVVAAGGYREAVAERVPETGLGLAINDRLRRAAQ